MKANLSIERLDKVPSYSSPFWNLQQKENRWALVVSDNNFNWLRQMPDNKLQSCRENVETKNKNILKL